jgi:Ca2+/Na+ antiporter
LTQIEYALDKKHLRTYLIEKLKIWGIVVLSLAIVAIGMNIWQGEPQYTEIILGALVFLIIYIYAIYIFMLKRAMKNSGATEKMIFEEDGIHHTSATGSGIINWTAFKKWRKQKHFYYLKINALITFPIPVDSIPAENRTEFETLLRRKIGK